MFVVLVNRIGQQMQVQVNEGESARIVLDRAQVSLNGSSKIRLYGPSRNGPVTITADNAASTILEMGDSIAVTQEKLAAAMAVAS